MGVTLGSDKAEAARGVTGIRRALIVCPSWVGDAVMATPTLARVRAALPGALIGALVRPGIDEVLDGGGFFDEMHVDRASGLMGTKRVAAKVRARAYDAALLLTNSFSTALVTRLAFIPKRVGYDRDGRGLLLTHRLHAEKRAGGWAVVSAVEYYWRAGEAFLSEVQGGRDARPTREQALRLRLGMSEPQEESSREALRAMGLSDGRAFAVVNPGGNNPGKRWPAERFAAVAASIVRRHAMAVLVNGSPGEAEVVEAVVRGAGERDVRGMVGLAGGLGALKGVVRRARLMVSNDTGPRHIAAAYDVPTVTLFGPTDPRWTTLPLWPGCGGRVDVVADPDLPKDQVADDEPERCRIDRISVERVLEAVGRAIGGSGGGVG